MTALAWTVLYGTAGAITAIGLFAGAERKKLGDLGIAIGFGLIWPGTLLVLIIAALVGTESSNARRYGDNRRNRP